MIDYFIKQAHNPLSNIKVDLGTDEPLWKYVQKAVQDIEIINVLELNPIDNISTTPFIHVYDAGFLQRMDMDSTSSYQRE